MYYQEVLIIVSTYCYRKMKKMDRKKKAQNRPNYTGSLILYYIIFS